MRRDGNPKEAAEASPTRVPPIPPTTFTAIDPAAFQEGFSESRLIAFLAKDVLKGSKRGVGGSFNRSANDLAGAPHLQAKSSLEKVQTLIGALDRAESELQTFQKDVSKKVSGLQTSIAKQESMYKGSLLGFDGGADAVRDSFRVLEDRMNKVSQVGTRIGDRLQSADNLRTKATQLVELVEYLHLFSILSTEADENNWKGRGLPALFWDDKSIPQAAAYVRKLKELTAQAEGAKQRSRMVGAEAATENDDRRKGSLENTLLRLEQYASWLEARVMVRFDRALASDNRQMMSECGKVMSEFNREKALIQRYVSTQPMFTMSRDAARQFLPRRPRSISAVDINAGLKPLLSLYDALLATVKDEAQRMIVIFKEPLRPAQLLVQRMFAERVMPALEKLLEPRFPNSSGEESSSEEDDDGKPQKEAKVVSADTLQIWLVTAAEAFSRSLVLISSIQAVPVSGTLDMGLIRDSLFTSYLADYPEPELRWLSLKFKAEVNRHQAKGAQLNAHLAARLIGHNSEALRRAAVLSGNAPSVQAATIRRLFHGEGPFVPVAGCLLELLARHIIEGVEHSLETCAISDPRATARAEMMVERAARAMMAAQLAELREQAVELKLPPPELEPRIITIPISREVAAAFVSGRIAGVLVAVSTAVTVIKMLQLYYSEEVAPLLAPRSIAELNTCSNGLQLLGRAMEESVLMTLTHCVDAFIMQTEMVLMFEQKAEEFCPSPKTPAVLDAPTNACLLVTALLAAMHKVATKHLEGSNQTSFLLEMGSRLHGVMQNHMKQYVFNVNGALRWRNDLTEYLDCINTFQIPSLTELFTNLLSLTGVLLVAPESLVVLVNGTLRLSHSEAIMYVRLREDFATATIEGRALEQVFAKELAHK